MTGLAISNALLWVLMLGVIVALWLLARHVGDLHERIAPRGAPVTDAGPKPGEASRRFDLSALDGATITIGGEQPKSQLLFFLSPTCPACKKLLPILRAGARTERDWLEVIIAGDGDATRHLDFHRDARLEPFPHVLSADLLTTYGVSRLPFAVLLDRQGVIRARGVIENREQLESLFNAKPAPVQSVPDQSPRAARVQSDESS
jgi:methylamine dehydrogenase accessory protein MauD